MLLTFPCWFTCPSVQVIIIEGIYSMEGEMVRLKEIVELKKRYKVRCWRALVRLLHAWGDCPLQR